MPLVRVGVSPHAPYTTSGDVYEACAGLGAPLTTHLAESEAEQDWVLNGTGTMTAASDRSSVPARAIQPPMVGARSSRSPYLKACTSARATSS